MGKNQHILKRENGWGVRGEGNGRDTKLFDTQQEAIEYGRGIAKNQESELIIHNRENRIRARDTYGNDPHPPKG